MDDLDGMAALTDGVINQRWPHTVDAKIWADEFCKQYPAMDHATMLGWFANAIMAGWDTATIQLADNEDDCYEILKQLKERSK